MKHSLTVTLILLGMFLLTQVIGIFVVDYYNPEVKEVIQENGTSVNITTYHLPYGMDPPQNTNPKMNLVSILISIAIAIGIMVFLMNFGAKLFLRAWFFIVVALAIGITFNSILNAAFREIMYASVIAFLLAIPLAYLKIVKRNMAAHNFSELLIYPGIAAIFVPLLNLWTTVVLLIFISIYDAYAVWHSGFMQKMAKYQMQELKFFSGFLIPYIDKKQRDLIARMKKKELQKKNVKVNVAILGGGDVVFPIVAAGVVLRVLGIGPALIVSVFATIALALLFYFSEKGKFYPAMPFISAGCFIGMLVAFLVN